MPHVIVKMYPGRTDADKQIMAEEIALALSRTMAYKPENVSLSIEEVNPEDWMSRIYEPEIAGRPNQLVRRPGYGPLAQ